MESPFVIETGEQTYTPIVAGVFNREKMIDRIISNDPRQAISRPLGLYMQQKDRERTIRDAFTAMDSAQPRYVALVEPVEAQSEDPEGIETHKVAALIQGEPIRFNFDGARA